MNYRKVWPDLVPVACPPPSRTQMKSNIQRFRKGVGGRGLATNSAQNTAKHVSQNSVPLLIRGHRKKKTEKRLEFMVWEGFPCANPLCPPTPFRNFGNISCCPSFGVVHSMGCGHLGCKAWFFGFVTLSRTLELTTAACKAACLWCAKSAIHRRS